MKLFTLCLTGMLACGCASLPRTSAPVESAGAAPDGLLTSAAQSDLYLGVVEGLIHQQRYEAAIAFLAKYQKNQPLTPHYQRLAGDALAGAGRYDEAMAAYRLALKSDLAPEAYDGMGRTWAAQGRWPEAAENFHMAATLDPANSAYLNNFAYAQLEQNFRGGALAPVVRELRRAHELNPASRLIASNLALALTLSGARKDYLAFLETIADPALRQKTAAFAANWTPGQTTVVAENAP